MNYKKTIRLFDPFGGWGSHGSYSDYTLQSPDDTSYDTGLCNRLLNWEAIYYILEKCEDNDLHIAVQNHIWPELPLLNIPDTVGVDYNLYKNDWYGRLEHSDLYFKTIFDYKNGKVSLAEKLTKSNVLDLFKNKSFKKILDNNHWFTDTGFVTLKSIFYDISELDMSETSEFAQTKIDPILKLIPKPRPLDKIELKNKKIHKKLYDTCSCFVGIHIRRGNGVNLTDEVENNLSEDYKDLYLEYKKKYIRDNCHTYRFAHDVEYFFVIDKILEINPKQKIYISHDLTDELIQQYYDKYPNNIVTKKDLRKEYYKYFKNVVPNLDHLINYANVLDNVLDLFSLSFCRYKILSNSSTWSNFADYYRRWDTDENHSIDDMPDVILNESEKFKRIIENMPKQKIL